MNEVRVEQCPRHGLRYNAAKDAGCVRCRKEWAAQGQEPPPAAAATVGPSSGAESGSDRRDPPDSVQPEIYEDTPSPPEVFDGAPVLPDGPVLSDVYGDELPAVPGADSDPGAGSAAPSPPPATPPERELADAAAAVRSGFGPALAPALAIAALLVLAAGGAAHMTHTLAYDAVRRGLEELEDSEDEAEDGGSKTELEQLLDSLGDQPIPETLEDYDNPG